MRLLEMKVYCNFLLLTYWNITSGDFKYSLLVYLIFKFINIVNFTIFIKFNGLLCNINMSLKNLLTSLSSIKEFK